MTSIDTTPDPKDRTERIKGRVRHIIDRCYDQMFDAFDRLHKRSINDDEIVAALRSLGENDILDSYAEWADIDLREDDNTTTSPDGVTDPGTNPSDLDRIHAENVQKALDAIVDQLIEERERELYFDFKYDGEDSMLDGPVNLRKLATAIVKGLGK